ncbi:MAG TPA: divergent polysaccharide deacetylase family protein [Terriglobales bacterium]|nr:divergent polysaccharide deacetylase family protein [Terriglobales bacterium]
MPRTAPASPALPRTLIVLLLAALLLVMGGGGWSLLHGGAGAVLLARWGLGDARRAQPVFAREIRAGLEAAGVPADSIHEIATAGGPAMARWSARLAPDASLLQANYAVSRRIEQIGGVVLEGRESAGPHGATRLILLVGVPGRPLDELVLVREPRRTVSPVPAAPRLALVLFGFGEDVAAARRFFALPVTFAAAIVPGSPGTTSLVRAAKERGREIVLHVPIEPVNYPTLNPGRGTLLVTMKPDEVTGTVRRWLDQSEPVVGAANAMGSLGTQDGELMGAIFRELKRRRVPFIHVQPTAGAVCRALTGQMGVIYDEPDAVLDLEARAKSTKELDRRWAAILAQARARGREMVWVRATPRTLEWLRRACTAKRLGGVELVPLSRVIRKPAML